MCIRDSPRAVRQEARPGSDLDHFEVFLARAALGTGPVHGDVGPGRACRHAVFGVAHGFVVDPAANQAHPGTRFAHGGTCLLYTSEAADERSSVELGGRRIIKQKKI